MKHLWLILFILFSSSLFADEKTFIREYTYSALKQDTKETARRVALYEIKMILLEEVGVYIQSEFDMKEWEEKIGEKITSGEFTEHKLTSITAGVTKTEILEEKWTKKWNKQEFYLRAKITLDPNDIQNKISAVINDRQKLKELEQVKKKADDAYAEIEQLKIQLAQSTSENEELRLTQAYKKEADILSAADWFNKGYNAAMNKEYDKAISFLLRGIALDPNNATAYINLGLTYEKQGNLTKAIPLWEKAIALDPNYASAYFNLGLAYYNQGNTTKAIQSYEKAIAVDPDYVNAYNSLGVVYDNQGKFTKAIQSYEKAIEVDPDYAKAYYNLGIVYDDQGKFTKAIQSYEKAIEVDPDYANAYYNLGIVYHNQGNLAKAIELFEKVIAVDPNYAEAYVNLGVAYAKQGNFDKALIHHKKAARLGHKGIQHWLKENGYEWNEQSVESSDESVESEIGKLLLKAFQEFEDDKNDQAINTASKALTELYGNVSATEAISIIQSRLDKLQERYPDRMLEEIYQNSPDVLKMINKYKRRIANWDRYKDITVQLYFIRGEAYRYGARNASGSYRSDLTNSVSDLTEVIELLIKNAKSNSDLEFHMLARAVHGRFTSNYILGTRLKILRDDLAMLDEALISHTSRGELAKTLTYIVMTEKMQEVESFCKDLDEGLFSIDLDGRLTDDNLSNLQVVANLNIERNWLFAMAAFKEIVFRDPSRDADISNIGMLYWDRWDVPRWDFDNKDKVGIPYIQKAAKLGNKIAQQWLKNEGYSW